MPDELKAIVKCANPKCITNNEPMATLFHVIDKRQLCYKMSLLRERTKKRRYYNHLVMHCKLRVLDR